MKYICSVCGYVYDEDTEGIPFSELSDDWKCPMCGAPKSLFESEETDTSADKPEETIEIDSDMTELSPVVLAAVFSNLARGAEKQYKAREAELFSELSAYFTAAVPASDDVSTESITEKLDQELSSLYPLLRDRASAVSDRGALRVTVWGEKVTKMAFAIMKRYKEEGSAFLAGTKVWVCSICGFIFIGENPPPICPVCKVPDWKFEEIKGGNAR